jgi:hypothetical protein
MATEISRFVKALRHEGWREFGKTWRCPCGQHLITLHLTNSCSRALRNLRSEVRKCRNHSPF